MGLYRRYVLPKLINSACAMPPMMALRKRYVPLATGRVLEIGIGSGLNLAFYGDAADSLTGLDPAGELTEAGARTRAGARRSRRTVERVRRKYSRGLRRASIRSSAPGRCVRFPMSIAPSTKCAACLKPDGKLIFIEHGAAPDPWVARIQRGIEPVWKHDRRRLPSDAQTRRVARCKRLSLEQLEQGYQPGPRFAAYMYHGVATPR